MNRLLRAIAVLAVTIIIPAAALAEPGQNGPPGPEGNPNADTVDQPPPTAAPGNSGGNPHGGPPGATGQSPTTGDSASPNTAPATAPGQAEASTAAEPAQQPDGVENGNGGGPDGKITICHATGSETNPYVVITPSVNGLHGHGRSGHQNDEDVIPAGAGGSCPSAAQPPAEPPGDDGDDGDDAGGPRVEAVGGAGPGGASGAGPSAEPRGTLPFTGLFVGFLALTGAMALAGGIGLRRAAADDPQDSSELAGLSGRRADVSRQAFAWADSVAARSATLEERLTTLERSLPS